MTIEEKNSISEEHKRFVTEIVLGLSLGNNKFLINVMWLDETAKRYHRLYPEVLGMDATFRTTIDLYNLPNVLTCIPSNQVQVCICNTIIVHFLILIEVG